MMKRDGLRIALVGPQPPPAGGMASLTRQLADLLRSEGASTHIIQTNTPYRPSWVRQFRGIRAVFRLLPYIASLWRGIGQADLVHLMANSGWSWHFFAAPAIWISALLRKPIIVNYHGGEAEAFLRRAAPLIRFSLRKTGGLIVPSGYLLDVFSRYGVHAQVVPNVVDLDHFKPGNAGTRNMLAPHIVVARNLEPIYGIDVALRAFALVLVACPRARMSVAGSGPLADELKALSASLGIADQVRFTGRLDRDQMAVLYRAADVLLNASRADNTPGAVLEAMASGVPVVATNVGGVPYMVEHERTGLLVPPDQPDAMAHAILRLVSESGLSHRLAGAALSSVRQYHWHEIKERLFAVYERALTSSNKLQAR